MHPTIQIVLLAVIAACLAVANVALQLFVATGLLITFWRSQRHQAQAVVAMLARLRWLFLSLVIIYFWFTPGQPLFAGHGLRSPVAAWIPTVEGVALGLQRLSALCLLVIAVQMMLLSTVSEALIAALYRLAGPLAWLGLSPERFAVRLVLVMQTVPGVQALQLAAGAVPEREHDSAVSSESGAVRRSGLRNPLRSASQRLASLYAQVLDNADQVPLQDIAIPDADSPPLWQWSLPLGLMLVAILLLGVEV